MLVGCSNLTQPQQLQNDTYLCRKSNGRIKMTIEYSEFFGDSYSWRCMINKESEAK